jgi:HEPN domain-containing protein
MLTEQEQSWIAEARLELEAARLLAGHGICHLAVFHARQSLEKLLKAAYPILGKGRMPHEHSLQAMVHRIFGRVPDHIWAIIKQLNPFYMSTRYVDAAGGPPSQRFDEDEADAALAMAEEAFAWIETQLIEKS